MSKTFTASLHPKAKLAEFLMKWRGRPVVPGESIDLTKLLGVSCTLVTSQQQNMVGRTYGSIDAISNPSKKVTASGQYDPAAMRRKIEEFKAGWNQNGASNASMSKSTSMSTNASVPCLPKVSRRLRRRRQPKRISTRKLGSKDEFPDDEIIP